MESLDVVVVYAGDGVVRFAKPEKDQILGFDGGIASWKVGDGVGLIVLHEDVAERTTSRLSHAQSCELSVEVATPTEVGKL